MNNKVLSLYDWFLIAGVIVSNVVYSLMTGTLDVLGSLAGITGVLCVVLVAKGIGIRVVTAPLLPHIHKHIICKAVIHICPNPEVWRFCPCTLYIISPLLLQI